MVPPTLEGQYREAVKSMEYEIIARYQIRTP